MGRAGDTGHGADTILIGETAPKGVSVRGTTRALSPRALHQAPVLPGRPPAAAARRARAPSAAARPRASPAAFRAAHPGLFSATGYAHHPYELIFAPNRPPRHSDWYTIANLPKLSALLRRVRARFGVGGGFPLYLTEFGYQTHPPDPLGVSPAQQARYLNQAEYLAYRNRNVRTLSQFLLYDDGPPFAMTFQSGLDYSDGTAKPAAGGLRVPAVPAGAVACGAAHRLHVWGLLRGGAQRAAPQRRRAVPRARLARALPADRAAANAGGARLRRRVRARAALGLDQAALGRPCARALRRSGCADARRCRAAPRGSEPGPAIAMTLSSRRSYSPVTASQL